MATRGPRVRVARGIRRAPGAHADHVFFGLSGRSLAERAVVFVDTEALILLAVQAILVGTIAVVVGALAAWARSLVRDAS